MRKSTIFRACGAVAVLAWFGHSGTLMEDFAMSASAAAPSHGAEAQRALETYDRSRAPDALRAAADVAAQDDGNPPADPAAAPAEAQARLTLWLNILARFQRDLDPHFDPEAPPPQAVHLPTVHGQQLLPGRKPSDLTDPEERAALEQAMRERDQRVARFEAMAQLAKAHGPIVEKAANSVRDIRDVLGLPAGEIEAAIAKASLLPADRIALQSAIAR